MKFWVQIHNILVACISKRMGMKIGTMNGEVLELDRRATGSCLGKFLWVRIKMDVISPLMKVINIVMIKDKPPVTIYLVYKRLPDFYMNCGMLDHLVRECPKLDPDVPITPQAKWRFGPWMRAQSPGWQRNQY